ncbi:unnamed protein product [Nezara viridula]|uniref:Dynein heavy chain, cytoplasmic n=1 Tax=Nezara viridula TaxID=85310 RepID=A0A9P0E6S2_NEZVI|nr:unnamed protein product [Nezara viridula]
MRRNQGINGYLITLHKSPCVLHRFGGRLRWDEKIGDCFANICDAQFCYSHEYLGNTPRLVITPLTDRCYITLTQSLHLVMGGGPAGPAGTGKTETTKDLGRALGIMVYVFNCSEQMDYKSCGNIYKGLAQTGAWGCFDEFNRITVEVLSVVAVQVKSLQRGDPGRPEEEVLMRALRDFNTPKIVTDDVPVFMGLIGDLFPALDVPRKRNAEFEHTVKQAAMDLLLQPEDNFILKVVQLEELLEVRHSVFVVGNAGTSKTQVWRTLYKTYQNMKRKPIYNDLNPKAVTNDELFGIINPATREWKDGLFSNIMREQANLSGEHPKWIVLDGDIDPMWIESLNTVMDDNKVLTLASNERIALTPSMRLLFEISNLRTATPATVSRAGILYINPQDLGWNPLMLMEQLNLIHSFVNILIMDTGTESLNTIYHSILSQHLANPEHKVPSIVSRLCPNVVAASINLHHKVSQLFLPTASKFHYIFNLRDISNAFQGLLFSGYDCLNQPMDLIRLWMHETQRVFGDKLTDDKDVDAFMKNQIDIVKKNFDEIDESLLYEKPNIYCHFAHGIGEPRYMAVTSWTQLDSLLQEALLSYNDLIAAMNLVLFEDAMMHVCRGSALLVGVGGSGKQSLSRLAAYISSLEVSQIQLRKGFGVSDLKAELASLYLKSGLKNLGIMFLMTDAQVANEDFLVLINDMLASGEIPELFPDDEIDNIIAGVRNEVKGAGLVDSKENCWKFFLDRVRRQLKVVLCFSPVGSTLRVRARKFPALINATLINWFHEWPQQALISVSMNFLKKLDVLPVTDAEERKVGLIADEVTKKQQDCEEDLRKAEPALLAAQVTMAKVDAFLDALINYDKENIHPEIIKSIQPYLKDEEFEPEFVRSKSAAAAGLCAWVINIIKFYEVYCDVEPKRKALEQANAELAAAQEKLAVIKAKVNSLEEQLNQLTCDFEKATAEKLKCQQEADATTATIQLANRLIGGLASENVRWAEAVAR